jgi:2-hydroxyacyl-CoA lyase 1
MRPGADVADGAAEVARRRLLERMWRRDSVAGHDLVARSLARCGVTHVYGVPGRPIDATLAACLRAGIRVIGARHQQGAALMSIAHNYVAGGLRSAVIVSAGPAVANTATGVLVAHDNRWPLLVIGGRRGTDTGGAGAFQGFDGAGFLAPITKSATMAADTEGLADRLVEACVATMNGAPGPVYVDVAEEALSGRTRRLPASMLASAPIAPGSPAGEADRVAIREAAHALAASRRPVLLIGKGLRWSADWGWLRHLVERHVVPFAAAPMARGFLPDDHPMCVNDVRGQALAEADLVMMVGARFNWTFHYGIEIAPTARIIRMRRATCWAAGSGCAATRPPRRGACSTRWTRPPRRPGARPGMSTGWRGCRRCSARSTTRPVRRQPPAPSRCRRTSGWARCATRCPPRRSRCSTATS